MDPQKNKWYDQKYMYHKDPDGKVQRYRKTEYKPRPGYVRLKWLEKPYLWWRFQTFDTRNALIPIFISVVTSSIIFNLTMLQSQRQAEMQGLARIPQQLSYQNIQKYAKERNRQQKQRKAQK